LNKTSQDFLHSLIDYEKVPGYDYDLDAYKDFLATVGSPQRGLRNVILIGGTKGKGSTAAIMSASLQNNGYRVGLYTSPHLKDINERIKIDGQNISNSEFDRQLLRIMPAVMKKRGGRSFFETLTTVAFLHFLEKAVDVTLLEVGLGGRLDATNAANPLLSVITRIGYDHTNLLGTRLGQIAKEKAGIIREGGILITTRQRPAAAKVLMKTARARKSRIIFAQKQHQLETIKRSMDGTKLRVSGKLGSFDLFLPLAGSHQIENASLSLAALYELQALGLQMQIDAVRSGIGKTSLHGRFEVVSKNPLIIFDCAHNEDSFKALEQNLTEFKIKDFYLVFGSSRDKGIKYCLKSIFPKAREVFLVKADNPRALEPAAILEQARKYQKNITTGTSVKDVLGLLSARQEKPVAILIAGSFYLWQKNWI
jgi:dihydrofolate synthase/folylpolyglutamate synthase